MFFVVSKLFWLMVQPISLSFGLVLLGGLLVTWGRRRFGLMLGSAGLMVLGLSAFTSLGFLLIAPLEDRFVRPVAMPQSVTRSEEHTSELQSRENLVCRLLLEKK